MFIDSLSSRASKAICSTTSRMKSGMCRRSFQTIATDPGFLARNLDCRLNLRRVVSRDLGADAVFQRRNDLSARRVVFRVGGKDQHHIQRQPDRITLNLHVAFLHDVEESDLNLAGEIRQLVDREDAAISARQQPVMNRQFIAEQMSAFRGFDRIDVADDVGDGHVGSGKFFHETRIAIDPVDRCFVAVKLNRLAAIGRDRDEKDRR